MGSHQRCVAAWGVGWSGWFHGRLLGGCRATHMEQPGCFLLPGTAQVAVALVGVHLNHQGSFNNASAFFGVGYC